MNGKTLDPVNQENLVMSESKITPEVVADQFRLCIEHNGANIAKLAEPLVKASCGIDKDGDARFHKEAFIELLHHIAIAVLSNPVEIRVVTYGFEKIG